MSKFDKYFKPNADKDSVNELKVKKGVLRTLYKGVKIPWLLLIVGAFLAVFNSLVILTQYENYMAIFSGSMTTLVPLWTYLAASFVQYILIFGGVLSDIGMVKIATGVRKKTWKKLMRLPLARFDDEPANGMLSRITSDAEYAAKPFAAIIGVLQLITYIMSIGTIAPTSMPQAWVVFVVILPFAVVTIVFSVKIGAKSITLVQNSISRQTTHYAEQLSNVKFIKACRAENKAVNDSFDLIENRYRASLYSAFATALQSLASNFTYIIIYGCAFLGGIFAIKAGAISEIQPVNEFYVFAIAMEQTLLSLLALPYYVSGTHGASKKLVSVFRAEDEDIDLGEKISEAPSDIIIDNVSFGYAGGDKDVIKGISTVVPNGKVTAIVGPNGSGKSTLVKLVDRLYSVNDGEITLNGCNASQTSLRSWRERFGVVSQNVQLFSGSIKDNICYGVRREVTEDELNRAVQLANLSDVVAAHDKGLDYDIGVKGSKLSGGEQQRVAIARALIKDPEYLILDEATANLDAKTEIEVKKGLQELMKGRTVIVVSHNGSMVSDADNVIVLQNGTIADKGEPSKLVKRCDFYRNLESR